MGDEIFAGLNEWTKKFVQGEKKLVYAEITRRIYLDGRVMVSEPRRVYESTVIKVESGQTFGSFNASLHQYFFPDGRVFTEAVQMGLCDGTFFLALKDEQGNWVPESLWPEEVQIER